MSNGYFSANSRVLLADGSYKNISEIAVGDKVLNKDSQVVNVTAVEKGPKTNLIQVQYQNWYAPLYCTGDAQIWGKNRDAEKFEWLNASEISNEHVHKSNKQVYLSSLQDSFKVTVKDRTLEPNYDLGLLFGLYAGYGSISAASVASTASASSATSSELVFRFGPNESLLTQVGELLSKLFGAESTTVKDEYCYQLRTTDSETIKFFKEFGSKLERRVPARYLATDESFVQGLFQGLIDFDPNTKVSRYIAVSRDMAELFACVCSLLELSFNHDNTRSDKSIHVYPLSVQNEQENVSAFYQAVLTDTESDIWSLQVDGPNQSFIVNNLAVR